MTKNFATNVLTVPNSAEKPQIASLADDPSVVGLNARPGSICLRTGTTVGVYYKSGALDTDWTLLAQGPLVVAPLGFFGDGSDGDAVFDGNAGTIPPGTTYQDTTQEPKLYTANRDLFYSAATVTDGYRLNPNGYRVYVLDTLTLNGSIERNGVRGSDGETNGGAKGAGLAPAVLGGSGAGGDGGGPFVPGSPEEVHNAPQPFPFGNTSGGVGGPGGSVAGNGPTGWGGGGGDGAEGFGGSVGGQVTPASETVGNIHEAHVANAGRGIGSTLPFRGGSGGGGGRAGGNGTNGSGSPRGGGGGGSGGGYVVVGARQIVGPGVISARGGAGGNGTAGGSAGGGGGGGGGVVVVFTSGATPNIDVRGGDAGRKSENAVNQCFDGGLGGDGLELVYTIGF